MSEDNANYKRFIRFLFGIVTLLVGVIAILGWWPDVVSLFRGFIGIVLAIAGLLVLYSVK